MFINWALGELNLKIVYYGPALSGKTTNLRYIYNCTPAHMRGELVSIKTEQDRTLLFDFLQIELGQIHNLKPRFKLYTVPGQVYYAASRRLVLQGADGVVFVADAQAGRSADNQESWYSMEQHLIELGYDLNSIPIVVQFNKLDMPYALTPTQLHRSLNLRDQPCFGASAVKGIGVVKTLKASIAAVIAQVRERVTS
jgi:mutual gliding-motility protein MglA